LGPIGQLADLRFASRKPRVVLSSLKWRVKNKQEFKGIRAFMHKNKVYLEKEKT